MVSAMQDERATVTEATLANLRDWIARSGRSYAEIAAAADVDEKSVRQARQEGWNPRATTLKKLEAVMPEGWRAGDPVPETGSGAAATSAAEAGRPASS
jgi:hypothetical protein